MAFCQTKWLSACLPQIVAKMAQVFADTHPQIKEVCQLCFKMIASVIQNPEITAIANTLI